MTWWSRRGARPWPRERAERGAALGARAGFTLLEALVALTIVGMALVVLTSAFGEGLRAQALARRHVEAAALAEARLSALAAMPDDSLRRWEQARAGTFPPPHAGYAWTARLARDPRQPRLVRATVTVRWARGAYVLETELYRRGLSASARPRAVRR